MGSGLFGAFPELVRRADEVLGYSVERLCLEDPDGLLGQTQYTQPALFVVGALSFLQRARRGRPDRVAGHSLGEYVALFAAEAFDFETGLHLVQRRGELMSRAIGGGMAAVVGLAEDAVTGLVGTAGIPLVSVANFNSPRQVVVAGPREAIQRFGAQVERVGGTCVPLPVSGAFHSPLMAEAAAEFARCLDGFQLSDPSLAVVSNVHARPYRPGEIRENLVAQITSPVRWTESVRYLLSAGEEELVEVGPGNVLSRLVEAIRREPPTHVRARPAPEPPPPDRTEARNGAGGPALVGVARAQPGEAPGEVQPERLPLTGESLGDAAFRSDHGLRFAYATGAMARGIASVELVATAARAGLLSFFGSGGLELHAVERAVSALQQRLPASRGWGVSLPHRRDDPEAEEKLVELLVAREVRLVEASGFAGITPALVRYRAQGLRRSAGGGVEILNRVVAKVRRPEPADAFLSPAPAALVDALVRRGLLTLEQKALLARVPMADDLCAESDAGVYPEGATAFALLPAIRRLRDRAQRQHGHARRVRVGAAGGIGTPEAVAAAFLLGADFVLTGSINQCTAEAGTSDAAKDLLQQMSVQDTEAAPAGEAFELGGKVRVLRRGLFFARRAHRLHELYRFHESLDAIDAPTRGQLEGRYFRKTFDEVYEHVKASHPAHDIAKAERDPKHKMALVFRWYLARSSELALGGGPGSTVDFQIACGPALGTFNDWVKGTPLEDWRSRHVDEIGRRLMFEAADHLNGRLETLRAAASGSDAAAVPVVARA
jgi:trans-AT polyketide synthase/acyltransferase/oxidoreductase domain-containing protein